jgi:hypothetical protein
MSNHATNPVSSLAALVGARSSASPTWPPCPAVYSASAKQAIRVRMHDGTGFLTARRLKERSSP